VVPIDRDLRAAEASAVIIWRGERIGYPSLVTRIANTSDRGERHGLFASYQEAVEAINPLREPRLDAWREAALRGSSDLVEAAQAAVGYDPARLAVAGQQFLIESETVYFAALRRLLALIDIEQGDATLADLWHVFASGWNHWFDERRVNAALRGTLTGLAWAEAARGETPTGVAPWEMAAARLRSAGGDEPVDPIDRPAMAVVGNVLAGLLMEPAWLTGELRMSGDEIVGFADFAAFARLWRLRRDAALLAYELRLYETPDPSVARAYFSGMLSYMTGVSVPEALYLAEVDRPWRSGADLRAELAAAMAADGLRRRHGSTWWRRPEAGSALRDMAAASSVEDAVAQLGYDQLDWRPVLRQIRTQLIGEMSGYGGPNITTRAGTRKV
jgi:hypothetical protein